MSARPSPSIPDGSCTYRSLSGSGRRSPQRAVCTLPHWAQWVTDARSQPRKTKESALFLGAHQAARRVLKCRMHAGFAKGEESARSRGGDGLFVFSAPHDDATAAPRSGPIKGASPGPNCADSGDQGLTHAAGLGTKGRPPGNFNAFLARRTRGCSRNVGWRPVHTSSASRAGHAKGLSSTGLRNGRRRFSLN